MSGSNRIVLFVLCDSCGRSDEPHEPDRLVPVPKQIAGQNFLHVMQSLLYHAQQLHSDAEGGWSFHGKEEGRSEEACEESRQEEKVDTP